MTLINFKGVRNLTVEFGEVTNIDGDNGTGKTTLIDAYLWLLFNKDSSDRKDFNIKTLDEFNKVIEKIDHEVTGEFLVDGTTSIFRKVYKEKWTKKKGAEQSEFTGNETEYFYNGVPLSQKEYQGKINNIFDENLVKLITNPLYFNSMKWQDRRSILSTIAGNVSDQEIAGSNEKFIELLNNLTGKTLVEYKREVASKRKSLKDQLDMIPVRIDESHRSKPEEPDYNAVNTEIASITKKLDELDLIIEDKSKAQQLQFDAIQQKQSELHALNTKLQDLQHKANASKNDGKRTFTDAIFNYNNEVKSIEREIDYQKSQLNITQSRIQSLTNQKTALVDKYNKEFEQVFQMDPNQLCCPTCKRDFDSDDIEATKKEMEQNFNNNKVKVLDEIKARGCSVKNDITIQQRTSEEINLKIHELEDKLAIALGLLNEQKQSLENYIEVVNPAIQEEIDQLKKQIESFVIPTTEKIDVGEYKLQRQNLNHELSQLNARLTVKDQIEKIDLRIKELEEQEKTLAHELTGYDKMDFLIDEFNRKKIEAIESKINSMFTHVRIKMFEQQINGQEVEICETLVNTNGAWVPYQDANTAGQINAGIDIINTLTNFHKINAPIFIDNRESVNNLIPCKSQVVNLIVSKSPKLNIAKL